MDEKRSNEQIDSLKNTIRFGRGLIFGLVLALLGSLGMNFFQITNDTVRIVPPEIKSTYVISSDAANQDYLVDLAKYVVSTLFNVTPLNVDSNNETILKLADPSGFTKLKTVLDGSAKRIKDEQITTLWATAGYDFFPNLKEVSIRGVRRTYLTDKLVSEQEKEYRVGFSFKSGHVYITKVEEIIKDEKNGASTPAK